MAKVDLLARLSMDGKGFASGLTKAKKGVSKLKASVKDAVGGMIKSFGLMAMAQKAAAKVGESIDWATNIRDLADQFGMTTKFVQELDYAFRQTGSSAETGLGAIREMMIKLSEATRAIAAGEGDTNQVVKSFKALGITVQQMKTLKPEALFLAIGKNLKDANMGSKDLHFSLNQIFGGEGSKLLVTFKSDLEGMIKRVNELGAIVDDDAVRRLGMIGDKMEEFKSQNTGLWADIAGSLASFFMFAVDVISASIKAIEERITKLKRAINVLIKAGTQVSHRDLGGAKRTIQEEGDRAKAEGVSGMPNLLGFIKDVSEKFAEKKREFEKAMIKAQGEIEGNQEKDRITVITEQRVKAIELISDLERKAEERKFKQLSPEQKLLELTKERAEALEKIALMPVETIIGGDITKDQRLKGLKGEEKEQMLSTLAEEQLAYKQEKEKVALLTEKIEPLEGKAIDMPLTSGGISQTYTALSKIGGQLGGKNILLDQADKQLKIAESSDKHLENISQVTIETFKG